MAEMPRSREQREQEQWSEKKKAQEPRTARTETTELDGRLGWVPLLRSSQQCRRPARLQTTQPWHPTPLMLLLFALFAAFEQLRKEAGHG